MAPVTHTLLVTPADALPCPPRFLTPKAAFNVVWVRAELSGAGEGLGHRCTRCPRPASLIVRNPYTGSSFLLAALPTSLLLLQWYEPLQKFLLLKVWGGEARATLRRVAVGLREKWRPKYVLLLPPELLQSPAQPSRDAGAPRAGREGAAPGVRGG